MMWMGKVSGIAALAVGALFVALSALNFAWAIGSLATLLGGALLLIGGFRTLRQMSGGLRLLAGAWGLAAGLMLAPNVANSGNEPDNPNLYSVDAATAWMVLALQFVPLVGLALTVLHKERKKP